MVELKFPSDTLSSLKTEMEEYIANGALLGCKPRRVHVYRPGQEPEMLENPNVVSGDPELQGLG